MDIFVLYFFVFSRYLVEATNVFATTRQEGPVSSYLGAEKTAKLLNFIKKMREKEKNYPFRRDHNREEDQNKDSKVPSVIESMKLLQKNYDIGKKYDEEHSARKFNLQVISNPEVLQFYKKQTARRYGEVNRTGHHKVGVVRKQFISNPEVLDAYRSMHARKQGDQEISQDRQREYAEEVKRNSRISMHLLKNPEGMDFRRRHGKKKSKSTSDSTSKSDVEDISTESSSDSDFRRSIVRFRVDEDLDNAEYNFNHNSDDVTDVTLKPEEAFDIVKPFIVEIFNKLKEGTAQEAKDDDPKSDDDDFYDPKKVPSSASSSAENTKKIIKLNLNDITTKSPARIWSQYTVAHETDKEDENPLTDFKKLKEELLPFPTTPDQVELDDSWRKKEKVKKIFVGENISADKMYGRETRGKNKEENNDWRSKKLPASKKSFVEPTLTHEDTWDDKGYGYWKKTNWEKEIEKGSSSEKHKNNKKDSMEHIRGNMGKKNKRNDSKELKKLDGSKSDEVWNKPKKENDWDKSNKKGDDWEKSRMKKDDWDSPKKKKDDWDSPKKKNDDWDSPKKKKDDWDSPKKKDDDWDSPKKKIDDWDKPKKKQDDWDTPKKKNDDWDRPKKKNDDWDSPKKQNDEWDKPKKKIDDWDQPKFKHDNDWDKGDNWSKKKDSYDKKDNDWNKKDTKSEKSLPDNKKRDSGWDMVGLDSGKNTGEKSYGSKKKSLYSEWGNYESFRNTKDKSNEKDNYKEMKVEDYKDDVKPKKKSEWDSFKPKYNYDRPRKAKTYDSYEKKPANSGGGFGSGLGGRTSIPMVGKKSVYAD